MSVSYLSAPLAGRPCTGAESPVRGSSSAYCTRARGPPRAAAPVSHQTPHKRLSTAVSAMHVRLLPELPKRADGELQVLGRVRAHVSGIHSNAISINAE